MKNQKILVVFILIIAFLLVSIAGVKASDNPLQIVNGTNNEQTQEPQQPDNNTANPPAGNNQTTNPPTNNTQNTNPLLGNTNGTNSGNNNNNSNLPNTGVTENTALVVFIAVCIASSVYAFIKIRNYKNV